jgi:kynurenine formamidase
MEDLHNSAALMRHQHWAICHTRLLDAACYGRYNLFNLAPLPAEGAFFMTSDE